MNKTLEAMKKVMATLPMDIQADEDVEGGMLCKITGSCGVSCNGATCTGTCPNTGA